MKKRLSIKSQQPEYRVKLDVFEGPLDLLLYLIEQAEIDIYDIPIAYITEEYLAYLRNIELHDFYQAGNFLIMATTLMQIKARMLLPTPPRPEEETGEEAEDPRWELVEKLLEYKKVKEAAGILGEYEEKWNRFYSRTGGSFADRECEAPVDPVGDITLWDLVQAFKSLLESLTPRFEVEGMPQEEQSVQDMMEEILVNLAQKSRLSFSALFTGLTSRKTMVTCFLAVLELIIKQKIKVRQNALFGDIEIFRREEDNSETG